MVNKTRSQFDAPSTAFPRKELLVEVFEALCVDTCRVVPDAAKNRKKLILYPSEWNL